MSVIFTRTVPADVRLIVLVAAAYGSLGIPYLLWRYDYGVAGTFELLSISAVHHAAAAFGCVGAYALVRIFGLWHAGTMQVWPAGRLLLRTCAKTLVLLYCASAGMVFATMVFFTTVDYERFASVTAFVARLERVGEPGYPLAFGAPALFAHVPLVEAFVSHAYRTTVGWLMVTWFLLAVVSMPAARRLLCAFCIAFIICIPVWAVFPTGSPHMLYFGNGMPDVAAPIDASLALSGVSPHGAAMLARLDRTWRFDPQSYIPASAFPSMHAAWAVLLMWYARRAGALWFGMMAAVGTGSLVGTVYFLQHFMIDIPAGFAVAALAIAIAARIPITDDHKGWYALFDDIRAEGTRTARAWMHDLMRAGEKLGWPGERINAPENRSR